MSQTVAERIYEAFWDNLKGSQTVHRDTLAALKALQQAGKLTDKRALAKLTAQIENQHAQNQGSER